MTSYYTASKATTWKTRHSSLVALIRSPQDVPAHRVTASPQLLPPAEPHQGAQRRNARRPRVEPRQGAQRHNARRNQPTPSTDPAPGPCASHEVSTDASRSAPAMAQPAEPRQGAKRRNARRPRVEPRQGAQRHNARRNQPTPSTDLAPRTCGSHEVSTDAGRSAPAMAQPTGVSTDVDRSALDMAQPATQGATRPNARVHERTRPQSATRQALEQVPARLTRFRPMPAAPRPSWLNQPPLDGSTSASHRIDGRSMVVPFLTASAKPRTDSYQTIAC